MKNLQILKIIIKENKNVLSNLLQDVRLLQEASDFLARVLVPAVRFDGDAPNAAIGPQLAALHDVEVAVAQRRLVQDGQLVAPEDELLPAHLGEV